MIHYLHLEHLDEIMATQNTKGIADDNIQDQLFKKLNKYGIAINVTESHQHSRKLGSQCLKVSSKNSKNTLKNIQNFQSLKRVNLILMGN